MVFYDPALRVKEHHSVILYLKEAVITSSRFKKKERNPHLSMVIVSKSLGAMV